MVVDDVLAGADVPSHVIRIVFTEVFREDPINLESAVIDKDNPTAKRTP